MSAIDLVILGHLINSPKSAYEMKKELESKNLKNWVKIGIPTIYQNLIKLYQKGFLDAKIVKESEMPEKTIYTINENGLNHFQSLMEQYSGEINHIYFDFCSFVENLDKVDRDTGLSMLNNLQEQFNKKRIRLEQEIQLKKSHLPSHALAIIKLYQGLFTFLSDWAAELREEYSKDHSSKEE
jgi:DNA-binding PadR family transcriptional regulator